MVELEVDVTFRWLEPGDVVRWNNVIWRIEAITLDGLNAVRLNLMEV